MARLPYAAKRLIEQVTAEKQRAKVTHESDPDGLGVVRTIKFDKSTSKWLFPLLEEIGDERIEEAALTEAGYLHVTFVDTPLADQRTAFPLDEAAEVLKN